MDARLGLVAGILLGIACAGCGSPVEESSRRAPDDASATPEVTATLDVGATSAAATATAGASTTVPYTAIAATPADTPAGEPSIAITVEPSVTAGPATEIAPTVPARNRPLHFSDDPYLSDADLSERGTGSTEAHPFPASRLKIASIGVDAPIDVIVSEQGFIPAYQEFVHVAGYRFTGFPGHGGVPGFGNTLIGGQYRHFDDTLTPGPPAVFFRLRELRTGDEIRIQTDDGRSFSYRVEFNKLTRPGEWQWASLISVISETTAFESVTLFSGDDSGSVRVVWARAYP